MKKMKYFLKIIGVASITLSFSVGPFVPFAEAGLFGGGGGISIPSPSQIASELETRYHINVGSVQDQSEGFNVANQKKTVPEVALFFSPSDPKPGEKITGSALPSFFSNEKSDLYFSWYLKRNGCNADSSPSAVVRDKCDYDDNGRIDVNDWKIEAMRSLVLNGFDNAETSYGSDTDADGYSARFGGDNKVGTANNYCAAYDASSGTIYEVVKNIANLDGICGSGLTPACIDTVTGVSVASGTVSGGFSGDVSGSAFSPSAGESVYAVTGYPQCSSSVATCASGSLRCVADPRNTPELGSSPIGSACSGNSGIPESDCTHLFPRVSGFTAGDGSFGAGEERFWHTDPTDSDTADNGNKDEANIIGLGRDTFTWNYDSGDQVGVVVEGTSMITTKHDDASSYVMWGFSKNNCPLSGSNAIGVSKGSYTQSIRGYSVSIPAATANLNDCLERNLVDPTEGGQPTRMEVSVAADPESPVNDMSGDMSGDIVTAYATVANGSGGSEGQLFDWKVSIANNIQFDNSGNRNANDITDELKTEKLLNMTRGNGLSQLSLPMNMPANLLSGYTDANGVGYIRFSVDISENFSSNVARKGRSDVILKFQNISDRISAYQVTAAGNPLKLSFQSGSTGSEICNDNLFRRAVCPVVKNEIIGLKVGSGGFTDYRWTVNGQPLLCSSRLSSQCSDTSPANITFLPIFGETGDTFTVAVDAVNIVSGKKATLSRVFRIVDPTVEIISTDTNQTWPKFLGQYKDAAGNFYSDLSRNIFQVFGGGTLRLKASFMPPFLRNTAQSGWTIDGEAMTENADGEIEWPTGKAAGGIYNVAFDASVIQSPEIRQALQQFWNISVFNSGESRFSKSIQVEVMGSADDATTALLVPGSKKFAALASYVPASVLFTIKAFFSMALILIVSGFMMALIPEASLSRTRD